ncbi:hypothetical protein FNV43_RR24739 [Rhamnella rubrinervis]|uniref:Uncharacterized protein n=1 Tax=Rhamnella rubrinervis TaxID=2594499 RepID=A0A8K0DRS4_9ROSA|nr:hypothetical protein FNV43_RR24739 [Rhamnella rubrinervis]
MSAAVKIHIPVVHHGDLTLHYPPSKYYLGVQNMRRNIEIWRSMHHKCKVLFIDNSDDDLFNGANLPFALSLEHSEGEPIEDYIVVVKHMLKLDISGATDEDDHDVETITEALVRCRLQKIFYPPILNNDEKRHRQADDSMTTHSLSSMLNGSPAVANDNFLLGEFDHNSKIKTANDNIEIPT